ncbi:MAG: hypothetical protein ACOY4F_06635 [Thermodesulfobacteriota bacterium]
MKVFRELYLYLPVDSTDEFFKEVENNLCEGWIREHEAEERSAGELGEKYYYFSCEKDASIEAAAIAFARRSKEILYIANIVPREFGELTKDQYNMILLMFYEKFLHPVCKKNSIKVEITTDNQSMADWVSDGTYKKLKNFSGAANKSTGTAHPCDQKRWFAFIVSVIRNEDKLDPSQLERWLIEEEDWQHDIASDLAIQYEQGISLLEYYKEN